MALTNYLSQSFPGTAIFAWGLRLYGTVGPATLCLLAFGLFALQLIASRVWLARFRFGPPVGLANDQLRQVRTCARARADRRSRRPVPPRPAPRIIRRAGHRGDLDASCAVIFSLNEMLGPSR
jgi:hypothetical protein